MVGTCTSVIWTNHITMPSHGPPVPTGTEVLAPALQPNPLTFPGALYGMHQHLHGRLYVMKVLVVRLRLFDKSTDDSLHHRS